MFYGNLNKSTNYSNFRHIRKLVCVNTLYCFLIHNKNSSYLPFDNMKWKHECSTDCAQRYTGLSSMIQIAMTENFRVLIFTYLYVNLKFGV